uniref:CCR4-NOT transcription complex subunit 2 n=1 Tax=Scophthalmus maximus TaxID=52904 RepID=A0A8D3CFV0_SCOMX
MFGANRKKFMEGGVESDYADDSSLYYSQQSMFPPHRADKDVRLHNSAVSFMFLYITQLSTCSSPSPFLSLCRGILPMSRSVMNHNQQVGGPTGQTGGMGVGIGGERGVGSGGRSGGGMGSPSRSSPSIIGMPKPQQARQPFTINSMSGFGVNRNPGFNLNNSLSNNIFNGTDGSENVTGLDLSDFPALADRSRRDGGSNPTPLLNPLAGRAPYGEHLHCVLKLLLLLLLSLLKILGMVTKPSSEQSQDFSIHNEDFPALPGPNYQTKDSSSATEDSKTNLNSSGKPASNSDGPKFPGDKSSVPSNNNQQKKGIQVLPDGRVTNIPIGMVTDQFGMIGLLTFIRAAETDPGMVHLALGSDLTTLGLNLNSPENLYPKFASPWASAPCRPQDIDFHVPSEYLTNIHIRDKLAAIKLSRYGEDLLFYLYYMNGGDLLQLLAAVELFNRDWRYHKEERVWITRAPGMEPTLKTNAYERGTYYFFDCLNWRKVAKEFHLEYEKLEERPHVPSTFNYNPAQQAF